MINWSSIKLKIVENGWLIWLLFFLIVIFVYWPTLGVGFFSDDYQMLSVAAKNSNIFYYFTHNIIGERGGGSYGPIWNLLFIVQYQFFHLHAFFYHLINVVVHVLNAYLVYLLVKKVVKNNLVSSASALVFLLLQNHTSAIIWISVQPHLFGTLFLLAALYFYCQYLENLKKGRYWLFLLCFTLSLFTKEISITFLTILILFDFFYKNENNQWLTYLISLIKRLAMPFLILVVYLFLRHYTTGQVAGYYATSGFSFDFGQMYRMFLELTANMFTAFPGRRLAMEWLAHHGWFLVLLLILFITFLSQIEKFWRKIFILFFLSYLVASLPFWQLMLHPLNNSGERYTYLISTFFCIFVLSFLYYLVRGLKFGEYLYIIMCTAIISYNLFLIPAKEQYWIQSGEVVKGIIASARQIAWQGKYVVFVGLPDNLQGGEVFRNAIKEAILMETGFKVLGERIPLYTALNKNNYQTNYFQLTKTGNDNYEIRSIEQNNFNFTGFKDFSNELGNYHLKNYQKPDIGKGIEINLNQEKVEALLQGKKLILVYYNNLRLNELVIE